MGRRAVTETDLDEGEEIGEATTMLAPGKRHCHAPWRKHRFCSAYPVKGEDYCKKHLASKAERTTEPPAQAVVNRRPVVLGDLVHATDLDQAIGQLQGDIAVLERAREIVQRLAT